MLGAVPSRAMPRAEPVGLVLTPFHVMLLLITQEGSVTRLPGASTEPLLMNYLCKVIFCIVLCIYQMATVSVLGKLWSSQLLLSPRLCKANNTQRVVRNPPLEHRGAAAPLNLLQTQFLCVSDQPGKEEEAYDNTPNVHFNLVSS